MAEQTAKKQVTRRSYDIKTTSADLLKKLQKLKATQKPGEASGTGTKLDVMAAIKDDIKKMVAEGYTAKQIAEAISDDTFGILPKTITELVNNKTSGRQRGAQKKPLKADKQSATITAEQQREQTTKQTEQQKPQQTRAQDAQHKPKQTAQQKPITEPGSFAIKPDRDDL